MGTANEIERVERTAGGFVVAFLSGAAIGAVAGILLAPKTGRESRQQLGKYLKKTQDNVRQFGQQAGDAINSAVAKTKDALEEGRHAMKAEREHLASTRTAREESERR